MTTLTIADLFPSEDYLRQLTKEEETKVVGGATAAGSISAGKYSERGGVIQEEAVTAAVATSSSRPVRIIFGYSFNPLFVSAETSYT